MPSIFDTAHLELWIAFAVIIVVLLAIDLLVANRHAHRISLTEAAVWSAVWIGLALLFNGAVWWLLGGKPAMEFLTGYLVEKSLSVDNLFVFVIIFRFFGVQAQFQHRVLFWGVIGAIVLRIVMITAGVALVMQFHFVMYLFGAFLVYTAIKLSLAHDRPMDPQRSPAIRLANRLLRIAPGDHGERFWVRVDGRRRATTLMLVLLVVEISDVIFAVDSIPTIFGITTDPFVLITSNIFAILGLRSLYFLLAGTIDRFHYLSHALALVLFFIGVKMLIADLVVIPTWVSLSVVGTVLGLGVGLSLARSRRLARQAGLAASAAAAQADPSIEEK